MRISFKGVSHDYPGASDRATVHALRDLDLEVADGTFLTIMGPSGSGKSTLLHLAGAMDTPTSGTVLHDELELTAMTESELTLHRRRNVGFIFQFFNLVPTLSVRENLELPLQLNGIRDPELVSELLDRAGVSNRAGHLPAELSGGEMQRLAVLRAVVHRPRLIVADEPTGNLDRKTGQSILDLISEIHRDDAPTIVMATHAEEAAERGTVCIEMVDGVVVSG
ncbi:MAG: ABC transporter ATP-binding protein [Acidobacteria bacterium]|nr:ABC transporter ATP-binding protein [Acidobacteriota bacterium]